MEYTTPREVNFTQYRRSLLEDLMELKQKIPVYVVVLSDHPILYNDSLGRLFQEHIFSGWRSV